MYKDTERLGYKCRTMMDTQMHTMITEGDWAKLTIKGEDVEDFITKKGNALTDKLIRLQKDRKNTGKSKVMKGTLKEILKLMQDNY